MSTKTVYLCDRCDDPKDLGPGCGLSIKVDRRADAAGGMEDVHEPFDLCHKCAVRVLRCLFGNVVPAIPSLQFDPEELVKWLKSRK